MANQIWTGSASPLNTPTLWINKYLAAKITDLSNLEDFPFFPSTPSTINDLTQYFNTSTQVYKYLRVTRLKKKKNEYSWDECS